MSGCDRTAEFMALINSKREKPQWIQQRQKAGPNAVQNGSTKQLAIDPNYKELMRLSQDCSYRIRDSFEKLERFTKLVRKRTIFDDGELKRLIADIKKDIEQIKSQLSQIKSQNMHSKPKHMENISNILHRKLGNITSNFKSTLEMRSRSVQQQSARHELFAGPTTTTSLTPDQSSPLVLDMGNPYENQQQQQHLLMNDHIDLSERANEMQFVESTIVELGTAFNQLAHMVQDQGETITRIDMNIEDTAVNVEGAHDALLRYFASVNSNRWLILKVFGVLFFFFILFVVFAA